MITLYDSTVSQNGYKVRLLLAHLAQPFTYVDVDILTGASRTPEFMAKNVSGRIPLLELEDGAFLPESGAILAYLADGTAYWPSDRKARADVLRWMFFEQNFIECNIGPFIGWQKNGRDKSMAETFAFKVALAHEAMGVLNRHLDQHDWLAAGAFSIADIANYGYIHQAAPHGFDMSAYPAVTAWMARMEALPRHVPSLWGSSV